MAGGRLSVLRRLPRLNDIPPPLLLIAIYAGFICLGTGALLLPAATTDGIAAIDALFTAVSAVTVTGLIVADTGGDFTLLGQAVIAVLIQLGGLGLMVFAILVLTALGIPVGMTQRVILREELNQTSL